MSKTISYLSFLMLLLLAHSAFAEAQKPIHFHYVLVMSQDDSVCKPLDNLYNTLLAQYLRHEHHEYNPYKGGATDFEVWEPEEFEKRGFTKPPTEEFIEPSPPGSLSPSFTETLSLVTFFGEPNPRNVQIIDGPQGHNIITSIEILKKDTDPKYVDHHNVFSIARNVVDRDAGFDGLLNSQKARYGVGPYNLGYLLTKWPHFDEIYTRYLKEKPKEGFAASVSVPFIAGATTSRIFLKDHQPYFIMNEYFYLPIPHRHSRIVVYKLTPSDHTDICYLSLTSR